MSETDSFIDEVTEEVRRDRLFGMMRRYGWIAILLVVLIVAGAAWREYAASRDRAEAQAFGDAILAALEPQDPEARAEALASVEAPGAQGAAVLRMLESAERASAGNEDAAVSALEGVAGNGEVPEIYREIAAFKAVTRAGEAMSVEDRRQRLEALATPGRPLRLLAEEQLALLEVEQGEGDAAVERLGRIVEDSEVTPGLRQRASQLIVALGGAPEEAG
ncbi:hypothetical protein [Salipiger mucosus]|uniref:Tetratricopeptide repeat-like domain-containing protein n=1 Tax=Salipiger mucosus DSM 16094 TaxID=1123237 RepID=S9S6Z9_9RHOB|nr:hypothetical protein [Salipiger mucosus]EPX81994.1 hypothetical protein Salmuc_02358 [Salipiger mucosus DSM 16094]